MPSRPLGECVRLAKSQTEDSDDILNDIASLYPDQCRNLHGDAGSEIIYTSTAFGELPLKLVDSRNLKDHPLFAHYLWNASLQLAELISSPSTVEQDECAIASVSKERVLELGAGCGLGGIISALAGASRVTISDYPSSDVLDNITHNVDQNLSHESRSIVDVRGHRWGDFEDELSQTSKEAFSCILCADCLWMRDQHDHLISSLQYFLSTDEKARILIVAGFHTGRATISTFWAKARMSGLVTEKIWEQDASGIPRDYDEDRRGVDDDIEERRKWLCIAVVKRRRSLRTIR